MDRTPYAERVECRSRPIAGSHGMWWKFRDPWDESFAKGVTAAKVSFRIFTALKQLLSMRGGSADSAFSGRNAGQPLPDQTDQFR